MKKHKTCTIFNHFNGRERILLFNDLMKSMLFASKIDHGKYSTKSFELGKI